MKAIPLAALGLAAALAALVLAPPAQAQYSQPAAPQYGQGGYSQPGYPQAGGQGPVYDETFSSSEIVQAGHDFFGATTRGLGTLIQRAFARYGQPNGYIVGEEAGGAFAAGLRYGEGTLNTKSAGTSKIYWQGPSVGFDFGANGARTMILVYNMPPQGPYYRYIGVDGSAYVVGGIGMTVMARDETLLVPIRTGLGLRLGASMGYLKLSQQATWNPF